MKVIVVILLFISSGFVFAKEETINEVNQYILDTVKVHVWGGFDTSDDIQELITELLEAGADEKMFRAAVNVEFNQKHAAEKTWPK